MLPGEQELLILGNRGRFRLAATAGQGRGVGAFQMLRAAPAGVWCWVLGGYPRSGWWCWGWLAGDADEGADRLQVAEEFLGFRFCEAVPSGDFGGCGEHPVKDEAADDCLAGVSLLAWGRDI